MLLRSTMVDGDIGKTEATQGALGPSPVRPGDVLAGKYRVDSVLGAGGMGVVVAATHLQLLHRVALKFRLERGPPRLEDNERFLREARAAAGLKSEHVARVLDMGTLESGAPYLVMEFLEGETLGALLRAQGSLSVDAAIGHVLQCCEGMAEAHARGIVHRDLKPENLFLTTRTDGAPLLKILDFGIAKVTEPDGLSTSLTITRQVVGSPQYMSPEQLRASRDVDGRADLWALGVILYQCLTGNLPFDSETFTQLVLKIAEETPVRPRVLRADVPAEVDAAVMRCLEKDPSRRFADAAELAMALAPFAPEGMRDLSDRARAVSSRRPSIAPPNSSPVALAPTEQNTTGPALEQSSLTMQAPPRRRWSAWLAAGGLVTALVVLRLTWPSVGTPRPAEGVSEAEASRARPAPPAPPIAASAAVTSAPVEARPTAPTSSVASSVAVQAPRPEPRALKPATVARDAAVPSSASEDFVPERK